MRILLAGMILSLVPAVIWSFPAFGEVCPEITAHERVRLSAVHDGDTLRLTDGRRVRLLAINAPELATDGKAEQALARASGQAAEAFFADTGIVHLSFESRRTDRYGRILAHVTHPSGRHLESYLVAQGLALALPVPPDLGFAACLDAAEDEARRAGRGLWAHDYWQALPATALQGIEPAFRQICGRVSKVDRQGGLWLELAGELVLRISGEDLPHFIGSDFDPAEAENWIGRHLRAKGWLRDRSDNQALKHRGFKPWMMQVRTPFALDWIEAQACED